MRVFTSFSVFLIFLSLNGRGRGKSILKHLISTENRKTAVYKTSRSERCSVCALENLNYRLKCYVVDVKSNL